MDSVNINSERKRRIGTNCCASDFPFRLEIYMESKNIANVLSTMNDSSAVMLKDKTSSNDARVTLVKIWATNGTMTKTKPCII